MSRIVLILIALAALLVVNEVLSIYTYLHVSEVGAMGSTGHVTVTSSYLIVDSVELRYGDSPGSESNLFDRAVVRVWVSNATAAGEYEVVVVLRNGGEVYSVARTVTITTAPTSHVFPLGRAVTQRSSVDVEIYARKLS